MFDRGLVSLAQDATILVKEAKLPDAILRLLNPDRKARLPMQPWLRPSPVFLDYHRQRHGF
jgi:putative restriction endonuclease